MEGKKTPNRFCFKNESVVNSIISKKSYLFTHFIYDASKKVYIYYLWIVSF